MDPQGAAGGQVRPVFEGRQLGRPKARDLCFSPSGKDTTLVSWLGPRASSGPGTYFVLCASQNHQLAPYFPPDVTGVA